MIKKILKILVALIIIIAAGLAYYLYSLKPTLNGNLDLAGLTKNVDVYYDDYGIPHIYAENDLDAMTALGYVHAQDRLWQMELLRRIASGRLSEIFGPDMIKIDRFYLNLGINENSKSTVAKLDKSSPIYKEMNAYLNGVNEYLNNGATPIEFTAIGIKKINFTKQGDSVLL